jgi:hypothetical protein
MATKNPLTKSETHEVENLKQPDGKVREVQAASVALAAAIAARKPNLFSKNMLQLYAIMSIGYLVSTMNGYDGSLMVRITLPRRRDHHISS